MWLDWVVQIRRGHKPSSADAGYFCSKVLLCIVIYQVLDDCIGIDHVEALVAKGECTTHRRPAPSRQENYAGNPALRTMKCRLR